MPRAICCPTVTSVVAAQTRWFLAHRYKLCYYRFGSFQTEFGKANGFDRARDMEIGHKDFELDYHEEAFTSTNWIVRIYKVKDLENRW